MTQSQQPTERTFIAVDFRGIQQASRERTSLCVTGSAGLAALADLAAPLPEAAERVADAEARPQLVSAGETALDLGGEGARAAFAYAALGGMVRLATTVGDDVAGDLLLRWLSERGVEVDGVRRAGRTPVTLHLVAPDVQPLTIASSGAAPERAGTAGTGNRDQAAGHAGEAPGDPDAGALLGPRGSAILLAGFPHVGPLRGEGAVSLFRQARERGVRTVLSLSPVLLGGAESPLAPGDLEGVLPHTDLICGSPAELRRATRRADAQDAARALIGAGAKAVLAKRGAEGAAVFRPGPAALEREDTSTPTAAASLASSAPAALRRAVAFGAVYDAAYLLGIALNDVSPVRFAAAAATRAAVSPSGLLGL